MVKLKAQNYGRRIYLKTNLKQNLLKAKS